MNPIFLALVALGAWVVAKNHPISIGAEPTPEKLPREREKLAGHLLANEHAPSRLTGAANLFAKHGHRKTAQLLRGKAKQVSMQAQVAKELVDQSRAGDQNATATIVMIANQAKQGSRRAQVSAHMIELYTRKNPPPPVELVDPELEKIAAVHGNFAPGEAPPPEQGPSETPLTLQTTDGGSIHGDPYDGSE